MFCLVATTNMGQFELKYVFHSLDSRVSDLRLEKLAVGKFRRKKIGSTET